jgi:hypothetical protein
MAKGNGIIMAKMGVNKSKKRKKSHQHRKLAGNPSKTCEVEIPLDQRLYDAIALYLRRLSLRDAALSQRKVCSMFGLHLSTFQGRLKGLPSCLDANNNMQRLSLAEEEILMEWCI